MGFVNNVKLNTHVVQYHKKNKIKKKYIFDVFLLSFNFTVLKLYIFKVFFIFLFV